MRTEGQRDRTRSRLAEITGASDAQPEITGASDGRPEMAGSPQDSEPEMAGSRQDSELEMARSRQDSDPEMAGSRQDSEPAWLDGADAADGAADNRSMSRLLPSFERWQGVRLDLGGRGALTVAIVGVVAAIIAGYGVWSERPVAEAVPALPAVQVQSPVPKVTDQAPTELVVSVVGLVRTPGLVRLHDGARIVDALTGAGGALPGADLLSLNMAQRVVDGDQILVGVAPAEGTSPTLGSATVGAAGSAGAGPSASAPGKKVSLNAASESELDSLPGVGPVTAAAIITWRKANGKFSSIEQLGEVDGIGPARLERLRELVTV